jgi:hypothetical protein
VTLGTAAWIVPVLIPLGALVTALAVETAAKATHTPGARR